jgi:hypothetical protein
MLALVCNGMPFRLLRHARGMALADILGSPTSLASIRRQPPDGLLRVNFGRPSCLTAASHASLPAPAALRSEDDTRCPQAVSSGRRLDQPWRAFAGRLD